MKLKKLFSPCNIYIALFCIFYLGGLVYPREGTINQIIVGLIILFSGYYAFKLYNAIRFKGYLLALLVFLVVLSLYGLKLLLFGDPFLQREGYDTYSYLRDIIKPILPIYAFYYLTLKGYLTIEVIKKWMPLLVLASIAAFVVEFQRQFNLFEGARSEFTNGTGYLFAALMPLVLFFKGRPLMQYLYLVACIVFLILGMKRGALLIGAIETFILMGLILKDGKHKVIIIGISLVAITSGIYFTKSFISSSDFVKERIEDTLEGNTSGRDDIYGGLYKHFREDAGIKEILIGGGAETTIKVVGIHAHNDWLELLTNQGLLGVLLYLILFFNLFKECRSKHISKDLRALLLLSFFYLFVRSFISMSYMDIPYFTAISLGYGLCCKDKRRDLSI